MRLAGHYLLQFYLLWGNIKTDCPEVHFLVGVNTRQDEEYPGSLGASSSQPAQTEDDRPLILLNHLAVRHSQERTFYFDAAGLLLSEDWNEQHNILDVMR